MIRRTNFSRARAPETGPCWLGQLSWMRCDLEAETVRTESFECSVLGTRKRKQNSPSKYTAQPPHNAQRTCRNHGKWFFHICECVLHTIAIKTIPPTIAK
jgi:hypothetical protein